MMSSITRPEKRPVPTERIQIAEAEGLANVSAAARACRETGIPFWVACGLIEQESKGANVYGHDRGGVFSTNGREVTIGEVTYSVGSDVPVTPANFGVFLIDVADATSNGVGPCQITYKPYFRIMLAQGLLPWDPFCNMLFGFGILRDNYARVKDWRTAFGHYNGGTKPDMEYGGEAFDLADAWRDRFAA